MYSPLTKYNNIKITTITIITVNTNNKSKINKRTIPNSHNYTSQETILNKIKTRTKAKIKKRMRS